MQIQLTEIAPSIHYNGKSATLCVTVLIDGAPKLIEYPLNLLQLGYINKQASAVLASILRDAVTTTVVEEVDLADGFPVAKALG